MVCFILFCDFLKKSIQLKVGTEIEEFKEITLRLLRSTIDRKLFLFIPATSELLSFHEHY